MSAVKVAFGFCIILSVFEQTVSWTIDLPQVRKYFFEKSLEDRIKDDIKDKVVYDNINTQSLHTDYDKYRENYADEYKYNGYMEQKVQDAVRNGSAYLEGLRRAVEAYTRRLEACRRLNVSANIIQLRPNNSSFSMANLTNFNLPTNFTNLPANLTYISQMSVNFTRFMAMSTNYTMFNVSDGFRECMRADLASEHVRRLAQLAVWAASELQDKLYSDKYEKHGHHDDALVLRLAWFLDRLAHLTGYEPNPGDFLLQEKDSPSTPPPAMLSFMPTLISNEDLQRLTSCMQGGAAPAPERCAFSSAGAANPDSFMSRGWPAPSTFAPDLKPSASENQEYTYSEQEFTDDDMPLSLPQRPAKTKRKRSVQVDPLQNFVQYYAKYKAWTGSNQAEKDASEMSPSNSIKQNAESISRTKRFTVEKKFKHLKTEHFIADLGSIVKHKIGEHIKKDVKEAKSFKKFLDKLHVKRPKTEVKLLKFKKSKRSVNYSNKVQPRVPLDPQMDISYYVKNKPGRSFNNNAAQAALVRAGVEQVFQTGNIEVVRRYGSNYNPANRMQIAQGYIEGYIDV